MTEDNQNQETEAQAEESVVADTPVAAETTEESANNRRNLIIGAVVAVLIVLIGLLYVMEKNGQLNTGMFDFIEQARMEREVVAEVNGEPITGYDLSVSQEQIGAAASAQGVDTTDPDTQASIREQAIEMLVNTELLRQEADSRGLTVSTEEVTTRYEQLVTEVGGEDVLQERMAEFGVTENILLRDIRNELTIQKLLDEVFASSEVAVTDEEIQALYDTAGGAEGGLPAIEEVSEQIRQQIVTTKEQEIVNDFVESLREQATIDINIEI